MKKVYADYVEFKSKKLNTHFMILNKDEINRACFSPSIVGYDIIQIESGNKDEYIVEVIKRD